MAILQYPIHCVYTYLLKICIWRHIHTVDKYTIYIYTRRKFTAYVSVTSSWQSCSSQFVVSIHVYYKYVYGATATHSCNMLLHYATATHYCNTKLQHATATHYCNTLQQHATATHYCNTLLQHNTATQYYNTLLQHTTYL